MEKSSKRKVAKKGISPAMKDHVEPDEVSDDSQEDPAATEGAPKDENNHDNENVVKELQSELSSLKEQLEKKSEEASENYNSMLRIRAEFDNYRKRIQKEQSNFYKYANQGLVDELLTVVENLERALTSTAQDNGKDNIDAFKEGIDMTLKQFIDILEKSGLKPIECINKPFDPELHEALSQVETDDYEDNTVIEEFQKGYFFKDRVLKHSKVVVSKRPVQAEEAEPVKKQEDDIAG